MIGRPCLALKGTGGQAVNWAADSSSAPVQNVGVDHGCPRVLVAEEFLDGTDVVAVRKHVGGEVARTGHAPGAPRQLPFLATTHPLVQLLSGQFL